MRMKLGAGPKIVRVRTISPWGFVGYDSESFGLKPQLGVI